MKAQPSSRRKRWLAVGTAGLLLGAVVPLTAAAAATSAATPKRASTKPAGPLSARLHALTLPSLAAASVASQNVSLSLRPSGAGSLLRSADGRLIIDARTADTSAATLAALARVGTVIGTAADLRTTTLAVATSQLEALARVPGLQSATETITPLSGTPDASTTVGGGVTPSACGSATSEADIHLRAALARSTYGVDGTGQSVGVLSDSYNKIGGAAADVASGDLPGAGNPCGHPTPVQVLDDSSGSGADEGRAMAQLVHDLAPGATLKFATAFTGINQFASNIIALKTAGATVIADDVTYFAEPFYQDGPVSVAVNTVTTGNKTGYFSSAANSNVIVGGTDVASFESSAYRPTPCPALPEPVLDCHDFDRTAGVANGDTMAVASGGVVQLDFQWAEPWFGVADDFDIFLVDATTGMTLASSAADNLVTQQPFEFFGWQNTSGSTRNVRVVIARYAGTGTPRVKFTMIGSGGINSVQFNTSGGPDVVGPSIFGHNGASTAASIAAVPSTSTTTPETYSSRGPVTLVFKPVNGTTPAGPLPAVKKVAKPDFAATDCVHTTFFYGASHVFCGTSAAAPHAAAVSALMRQRSPSATRTSLLATMAATAAPLSGGTVKSVGAGLVDAVGAVGNVVPTIKGTGQTKLEGNSGTTTFTFTLTLSNPSATAVTVKVKTLDGTATAPSDYIAVPLTTVTFAPGVTIQTVNVSVIGDLVHEANEVFYLQLTVPTNAFLAGAKVAAHITNDD